MCSTLWEISLLLDDLFGDEAGLLILRPLNLSNLPGDCTTSSSSSSYVSTLSFAPAVLCSSSLMISYSGRPWVYLRISLISLTKSVILSITDFLTFGFSCVVVYWNCYRLSKVFLVSSHCFLTWSDRRFNGLTSFLPGVYLLWGSGNGVLTLVEINYGVCRPVNWRLDACLE